MTRFYAQVVQRRQGRVTECCGFFFSAENLVFTKLSSTFNIFTQVHFNVLSQI